MEGFDHVLEFFVRDHTAYEKYSEFPVVVYLPDHRILFPIEFGIIDQQGKDTCICISQRLQFFAIEF